MPTYNVTDDKTGMQLDITGDGELTEDNVHNAFGNARKQVSSSIADGSYRLDDKTKLPLEKKEANAKLKKLSAYSMGIHPDEIDMHTGSGFKERLILDNLPDDPSRLQYMEKKYGDENVEMLDVGGKPKMFYRDPKSNKMTMVDEQGLSFSDFTADISSAAITTVGAIGGAVLGTALAPGAGTGAGALAGATAGAALGGFLTGVTQDVAAEALTGQDLEVGKHSKQRLVEAAIGIPIDLFTAGVGRIASKAVGKRTISAAATEAKGALSEILEKTGGDKAMLGTIPDSAKSAAGRTSRLAKTSEGREASRVSKIHDQVDKIVDAAKGRVDTDVPVEEVIFREAESLRQTMKQRTDEIARLKIEEASAKRAATGEKKVLTSQAKQSLMKEAEGEAAKESALIDSTIDRLVKRQLKGAEKLRTTTGESIRRSVLKGYENDRAAVDELYSQAERVMKAPIYKLRDKHSLEPIAKAFDRVMKKYNITDPTTDYSYRLLEARLGKSVADDLVTIRADLAEGTVVNFSKLNSMVRRIEGQVKRGKTSGFTPDELIMRDLAKSMLKVRDEALDHIGPTAAAAWKKANSEFRKKILPRTENITDRAGKRIAGGSDVAVSPEDLADEAISSQQSIRQTIRSAEDPVAMRIELRGHYMTRIVDEVGEKGISIDEDIIRSLYLKGRDANAAIARLKRINGLIKNRKVDPRSITSQEIDAMVGDPLTPSAKRAMSLLEQRGKLESAQKNERFKALQKMAKGERPVQEDIHAFVDEFVRLDARDMKQLLDKLPDEASRNSLRRSALDHLLQITESGGQRGSRRSGSRMIFNPETMMSELTSNKGKWRMALGKETYDDMVRSAKVLQATKIPTPTVDQFGSPVVPKVDVGGGGGLIFYATGPVRWLGRKTMDLMHGSGKISEMLEGITASKEVDEELFKKMIIGLMGTRRGMEAVADESDKDKNFEQWLLKEVGGLPE
jgi:hypothetical protein